MIDLAIFEAVRWPHSLFDENFLETTYVELIDSIMKRQHVKNDFGRIILTVFANYSKQGVRNSLEKCKFNYKL